MVLPSHHPWRRAVATFALAAGASGCAPGFRVRGRGPETIGVNAGAGPRTPMGGSSFSGSGAEFGAASPAGLENEREDETTASEGAAPEATGSARNVALASQENASPASRYASLDRKSCEIELGRRAIAFERVDEARGVIAPLRLKGPLAGVDFHAMLPAGQRQVSPYEIYDCRLVLALDDWARVLARHDVVEVVHYSVYRPPSANAVLHGPGRRHTGGLAIDAALFKTRDGRTLSVLKDFHGRIGSKPCSATPGSSRGLPSEALALREIVCEAADAQLFNVLLTPDYNGPHRNHFHLEVTAGVRWSFVR